ncbi:MAG: hypothetical protein IKO42_04400, partial [Opitutales bacterium]|nr:hypothetical protein [Opitutales bacterium]
MYLLHLFLRRICERLEHVRFFEIIRFDLGKVNVNPDNYSLEYVSLSYNPTKRNLNCKNLEFKILDANKNLNKGCVIVSIRNLADLKRTKIFLFDPKTYALIAVADKNDSMEIIPKEIPKLSA